MVFVKGICGCLLVIEGFGWCFIFEYVQSESVVVYFGQYICVFVFIIGYFVLVMYDQDKVFGVFCFGEIVSESFIVDFVGNVCCEG